MIFCVRPARRLRHRGFRPPVWGSGPADVPPRSPCCLPWRFCCGRVALLAAFAALVLRTVLLRAVFAFALAATARAVSFGAVGGVARRLRLEPVGQRRVAVRAVLAVAAFAFDGRSAGACSARLFCYGCRPSACRTGAGCLPGGIPKVKFGIGFAGFAQGLFGLAVAQFFGEFAFFVECLDLTYLVRSEPVQAVFRCPRRHST